MGIELAVANYIYMLFNYNTFTVGGYIIGKRLFRIKVKRMDEEKLTLRNTLLREVVGKLLVVYLTVGISIIVSILMVILREDKRAIHDFIAGTYVSYDK
ncbi:RDD family protein [Robertmurraya massiliosenegalensis]|uniref:RDD family protein n=1 Tax=Robertmurraya massiliosenegalensis TaxID=1287657 RepID=UPI001F3724D4|nr:RDD family protein [Robertmurraya massiliosenegalensis]